MILSHFSLFPHNFFDIVGTNLGINPIDQVLKFNLRILSFGRFLAAVIKIID